MWSKLFVKLFNMWSKLLCVCVIFFVYSLLELIDRSIHGCQIEILQNIRICRIWNNWILNLPLTHNINWILNFLQGCSSFFAITTRGRPPSRCPGPAQTRQVCDCHLGAKIKETRGTWWRPASNTPTTPRPASWGASPTSVNGEGVSFVYILVCLPAYLSIYLHVCLSVCLSLSKLVMLFFNTSLILYFQNKLWFRYYSISFE